MAGRKCRRSGVPSHRLAIEPSDLVLTPGACRRGCLRPACRPYQGREQPAVRSISCASPRHEILARPLARRLLARRQSSQIAIATARPQIGYHVLALSETANIPIHFVHGRAALDSPDGQLAATLAEILLRGFSQPRVKRLVGLLRSRPSSSPSCRQLVAQTAGGRAAFARRALETEIAALQAGDFLMASTIASAFGIIE